MKKIFYSLALLASLSLLSCDDFLTEDVRGQENLDSYFTTETEAEKFLTSCYGAIRYDDWWQVDNMYIASDMCTDDYWMGNTTQDPGDYLGLAHYNGVGQSAGTISNFWQYRYKGILTCNIALDRIPSVPFNDESKKTRMLAEARFLRGFFYFDLVKNFGGVPIIDGFLMPQEVEGITRSTQEEVYALVEEDLSYAAANLPQKSQYAATDMGRATRGAALGLLGKAQVYQAEWNEARTTLKTLIDEGEYDLLPDFGQVWSVDYNNSIESLFETQGMFDETYNLGGTSIPIVSGIRNDAVSDGWAWGLPTSNLEAAFLEAGDDIRLGYTIIKNGDKSIAGEPDFATYVEAQGDKNGDGSFYIEPAAHKSARASRKYYIPYAKRPTPYSKEKCPLNYRILRYADVLLLYAEACNETGDDTNARWALNKVRNRAGLTDVNATGDNLRKAIRTERRLELATEAQRLYDIRRWTDSNGKKVICNLFGQNGSFVQYNRTSNDPYESTNDKESSDKGISFDENRDLVFPIPLYEIQQSNGSIVQNPGWN